MAEISRRALLSRAVVLAGLAAGAGLGLTRKVHHKAALPPPPPPAALTDALSRQQRLLAGYRVVGDDPARPALAGLRSDVTAHGDALRALLGRYPGWRLAQASPGPATGSSSPAPQPGSSAASDSSAPSAPFDSSAPSAPSGSSASVPGSVAELAVASAADARALAEAALAWPAAESHAAEVVPALASIAGCLASHAQVLG